MTDAKVTISCETLEQAIRALENAMPTYWTEGARMKACTDLRAALAAQPATVQPVEPVAWRDHVEQRIRTWRHRRMNEDGDRVGLDDFMDRGSIDDLVDFVCDEYSAPSAPAAAPLTHMQIVMMWGHRSDGPTNQEIVSFAREIERAHGIAAAGDKP